MKMPFKIVLALFLLITQNAWAQKEDSEQNKNRERFIGTIVKNALETYHYRNMKIDDSVSQKGFKEFLKRIDYSKQFLMESDVKALEKYQFKMDDQIVSGEMTLLDTAIDLIKNRVEQAEKIRQEILKADFDFTQDETLELDPDKRSYAKTDAEFKENWRKTFKHYTLVRYLSMLEDGDETKEKEKDKKDNKKKKAVAEKKLTDKEMRTKAREAISERYEKIFKRTLQEERFTHLEHFYNAVATIFDPHTSYLAPKRKEDFDIDISGQLEGIGAVLQEDGQYIKVVKVVPGGAAWRQRDLEVDDIILLVAQGTGEPVDLVDMRVDDAVRYIRGKKGTEVRLTVKKPDGTRKVIPIVRDTVQIDASYAKSSVLQLDKSGLKVGYILLPKFYRDFNDSGERNCTDDVKNELLRLKKQKVDGVILDLRNNGGGALEDARQMSGLFIEKGPIVQVKNHNGQIDVLKDTDPTTTYDGPLIVLVNRFSASASEILAAAMQDYDRGIVVGGEFTHGKGTVQALLPLNNGPLKSLFGSDIGTLKVTIQKFYRINGESTQYKGVTPDILLPDPMAYSKSREQDLEYSLPWDHVAAEKYSSWKNIKYDLATLKKRSEVRAVKDTRFQKIKDSLTYLESRKDETIISLNKDKVLEEEKKNKKITEAFKIEEETKTLLVTNYEDSLRSHEDIRPGDEDKWKKDFEQRKDEWIKDMRRDPILEESVHIMEDIVKTTKGQKLSMVP
jgi:carboxyl-terminal processing protease